MKARTNQVDRDGSHMTGPPMGRGTPYADQNPDDTRYRDEEWLERQYVDQGRSYSDIASECDVSETTIQKWLRKHRISRPDETDWVECGECDRDFRSKEGWFSHVTQVHEGTDEEERARRWISEENPNNDGMTDEHRANLAEAHRGKSLSEETKRKVGEASAEWWANNEPTEAQKAWYEACRGDENPAKQDWFSEMMSGDGNPAKRPEVRQKISENNPMKDPEIAQKIAEFHRGRQRSSEFRESRRGEGNPNWKGGPMAGFPYATREWRNARERALHRDGHECQWCGDEADIVHHLKPVRLFDDPKDAHTLSNVVSLCTICHGIAHSAIDSGHYDGGGTC